MTTPPNRPHNNADKQLLLDTSVPANGSANQILTQDTVIADLSNSTAWTDLKTREYEDLILHRKRWSNVLLSLVSLIIIMDFVIMILSGTNALSYQSSVTIPAFIGSSILEIFGLSYIVVQYLFPGGKMPEQKPNANNSSGTPQG